MANTTKLLKENKKSFKELHRLFGYDFEKEYTVLYLQGAFTINKIIKEVDKVNYIDPKITILTRNKNTHMRKLHVVTVTKNGDINIDIKPCYVSGIESFYRKYDFNEIRKKADTESYIIIQASENIVPSKTINRDLNKRYNYRPSAYEKCGDGMGNSWIYRINLQDTDNTGEIWEYKVDYSFYRIKTNNIYDIIDKSGYLLLHHRRELKARVQRIKIERDRNEYLKTDNAEKINELEVKINLIKSKLIEKLANATEYNIISETGRLIFFDFSSIVSDFDRFKRKTINKEYSRIQHSDNEYQRIIEKINKMGV